MAHQAGEKLTVQCIAEFQGEPGTPGISGTPGVPGIDGLPGVPGINGEKVRTVLFARFSRNGFLESLSFRSLEVGYIDSLNTQSDTYAALTCLFHFRI